MSATVSDVRSRTRFLLRDRDPGRYAVSTPELDRALERNMRAVAGLILLGEEWVALALTAGTAEYELTGSPLVGRVLGARRQSDGAALTPVSPQAMAELREGQSATAPPRNRPQWYATWESPAQSLRVLLHPVPSLSETIEFRISTLPEAIDRDPDIVIPFGEDGIEALAYRTAVELGLAMTEDQRAERKLDGAAFTRYDMAAAGHVRAQRLQAHALRAAGRVRRSRRR